MIRPASQHGPRQDRIDAYALGKGHARGAQILDTCLVRNDGTLLRTCQSYRHLGVILSQTQRTAQEVPARIKNMHVHYHPLARYVFLNEHLGEVVKSSLAKSLSWSVLFQGAGTLGAHWNVLDQ